MKRSEMNLKIYNKLKHEYLNSMRSWADIIEMVLDEAEELGMLPPTIDCEKWVDCEGGQGFMIYVENEWEDE